MGEELGSREVGVREAEKVREGRPRCLGTDLPVPLRACIHSCPQVCERSWFLSFFLKIIYLFYLRLFWVFVAACGLPLVAASGGYSSLQWTSFSLKWLLSLKGLRVHGLQWMHCTDSVVAAYRFSRAASVVVAHRLSCSSACGIFPDQGSNQYPPHWLVDSYTLYHQASPRWDYAQLFTSESYSHECYNIIVSLECKDTLSRYNVSLHSSGKHLYVWTQSQIDFNGEVNINIKICLMWKYMRHKPRVNPNKNHGLWMITIHNCRFINVRNVLLWWECWEQRRLSLCGIYREYMKTSLHLLFSCFLMLNFARKT